MLKYLKLFLALVVIITAYSCVVESFADTNIVERADISVYTDGQLRMLQSPPVVLGGRAMLPLRDLLTSIGVPNDNAHILWNEVNQSVTISHQLKTLKLTIGSTAASVDGKVIKLDAAPINYRGRIYLPARFIAENFDRKVTWDERNNRILIGVLPDESIKQVIVSSAEEFVSELGTNKRILLKAGVYDLTSVFDHKLTNPGISWEPIADGMELKLQGVRNLVIEGPGDDVAGIITTPRFANILNFNNCSGISLINICAGHRPQEYKCDAGVLLFEECSDIMIDHCRLYGCGSIGIDANHTQNLTCEDTVIYRCTLKAVSLDDSDGIHFKKCTFTNNEAYTDLIYLFNSKDVTLTQCEISNNKCFLFSLITARDNSDLTITDCMIVDNAQPLGSTWGTAYLFKTIDEYCKSAGTIWIRNTAIQGNECDFLNTEDEGVHYDNCMIIDNDWREITN